MASGAEQPQQAAERHWRPRERRPTSQVGPGGGPGSPEPPSENELSNGFRRAAALSLPGNLGRRQAGWCGSEWVCNQPREVSARCVCVREGARDENTHAPCSCCWAVRVATPVNHRSACVCRDEVAWVTNPSCSSACAYAGRRPPKKRLHGPTARRQWPQLAVWAGGDSQVEARTHRAQAPGAPARRRVRMKGKRRNPPGDKHTIHMASLSLSLVTHPTPYPNRRSSHNGAAV